MLPRRRHPRGHRHPGRHRASRSTPAASTARFEIGDGEAAKSLATVEELCRAWAAWGLTRADVVVAVGGGLVTDVAGFAAASYHRGVPVVHVPTTLLGMVDAAIGGKTGVNLPEGKNLVGAFWQPSPCSATPTPWPPCRPASCAPARASWPSTTSSPATDLLALDLAERIAAAVRIKADVVAGDEREDPTNRRGRAILNYGHTLAHALEIETGHDLRHGEAVGDRPGLRRRPGRRLGRIDDDRVAEHHRVLAAYELRRRAAGGRRPRSSSWRSWAATRRPSAGSRSCSTVPTASRSSPASTRPTPAPPWRSIT